MSSPKASHESQPPPAVPRHGLRPVQTLCRPFNAGVSLFGDFPAPPDCLSQFHQRHHREALGLFVLLACDIYSPQFCIVCSCLIFGLALTGVAGLCVQFAPESTPTVFSRIAR